MTLRSKFRAIITTTAAAAATAVFGSLVVTPASAQFVVKGDVAKGQEIAGKVCAACHGPDGNSPLAANPSLAGQHAEYIYKQLSNFKSKDGKPADGFMGALKESEVRDFIKRLAGDMGPSPVDELLGIAAEVRADQGGIIAVLKVATGDPVEYGQELFVLEAVGEAARTDVARTDANRGVGA